MRLFVPIAAMAVLAASCADTPVEPADIDVPVQGILFADDFNGSEPFGLVRLEDTTAPGSYCSGIMVTNRLLLTASHCMTGIGVKNRARIFHTNGTSAVEKIRTFVKYPGGDLAIVKLDDPFFINGDHFSYKRRTSSATPTVNQSVFCAGYGINDPTFFQNDNDENYPPSTFGAGILRAAWFTISAVASATLTVVPTSPMRNLSANDSGAPCLTTNNATTAEIVYINTNENANHTAAFGVRIPGAAATWVAQEIVALGG